MTHVHVCRLCKSCQCLVCLTCLAGKMSSKTILIGLSIFRCGVEKSVHGRPSWELAPYDCSLQNTKDFTAWCKLVSRECKFTDRAGECGVVRYTTQFFVLDKAKALPIRIGSQTAWDAVRLDFIDNKEKVITKDYELHGRCHFLAVCTVILEKFRISLVFWATELDTT